MALPAPTTLIDALPYVDSQYNDPKMKQRVDQLVQAEMETFAPRDYVAHLPQYEPNFEVRARGARPLAGNDAHRLPLLLCQDHPLLQAEWMRICDQQPMSRIDTSRYALDAPPAAKQADPQAWRRAVENAEAQHEHQNTRSVPAACSTALCCAPPPPLPSAVPPGLRIPPPPSPRTTFGRLNNLELLQKHGANLWTSNQNGDSPLLLAAKMRSLLMTLEVKGCDGM